MQPDVECLARVDAFGRRLTEMKVHSEGPIRDLGENLGDTRFVVVSIERKQCNLPDRDTAQVKLVHPRGDLETVQRIHLAQDGALGFRLTYLGVECCQLSIRRCPDRQPVEACFGRDDAFIQS